MSEAATLIASTERATQDELIRKIMENLHEYEYIGNLKEGYHTCLIEDTLRTYLVSAGNSGTDADQAIRELRTAVGQCTSFSSLRQNSEAVYSLLRYGAQIAQIGSTYKTVEFIDWKHPENNSYQLAEEVTVKANGAEHDSRRPDVVLYVNGIALAVIELKKSSVSVAEGIRQNYRNQQDENIPQFFATIQLAMAGNPSEGLFYGTTCTSEKFYLKWKEPVGTLADDEKQPETFATESGLLNRSVLQMVEPSRMLEFIHDLVVYDGGVKKVARPNQYFALKAAQPRIKAKDSGIIWHSQGSGKSLTMVWLAQWIRENVENARVVIITDRDELDKQITNGLRNSRLLAAGLPDKFYHAESRNDLLNKLDSADPWLITTLIHKFGVSGTGSQTEDYKKGKRSPEKVMLEIAENLEANFPNFRAKGNIFVFIDECHRTQGGVMNRAMKKIMGENVMLIGFTGTPLLKKSSKENSMSSQQNFGRYIHTYRFNEAVEDGVVLDLRYEARDVDQHINNENALDQLFEKTTRRLSSMAKADIQARWTELQKLYSSKERMERIVADILYDMDMKPALQQGYGNAMLVCDSIYQAYQYWNIFRNNGFKDHCAVVSSYEPTDPSLGDGFTGERLTEEERKYKWAKEMMGDMSPEAFEEWAKDQFVNHPASMKLLIVCDKLLTGFDAPSATYLYLDKKVVEHTLFQAICRVNRVNGESKLFGYIVDYRKLFEYIEGAIRDYTTGSSEDNPEGGKEWDPKEIEKLMKDRMNELKKELEDAFEQIAMLTEEVKEPKDLEDYCEYFCYPRDASDDEQVTCIENRLPLRVNLYNAIKRLERIYADMATDIDMVYTADEAQAQYEKVRFYEQLRIALMLRSGDSVDLKIYDAEMRALIDRYVSADASEMIDDLSDVSFLNMIQREIDGDGDNKKRCGGERGSAEAIGHNTRARINRARNSNANLYERLSKRLKKLLEDMRNARIEYAEFLMEIKKINEELISGGLINDPRLDNIAKKALYDNLGEDADLALEMYDLISNNAPQGFRSNLAFQAVLKRKIAKRLEGTGFDAQAIFDIAYAHPEIWI